MHKSMIAAGVLFTVACAPEPPPAENPPPEIEDATTFIFTNFRTEKVSDLEFAVAELLPFIEQKLAAVKKPEEPLDASWYVELDRLDEELLGDLEMPEGVTSEEQKFPLGRVRSSAFPVADVVELATEPNRVCLESETTLWAERSFTSDTECFVDGSCDSLQAVQETYKQNPLTAIWYDQQWDHRTLQIEVDGEPRDVLLTQGWLEERFFSESGGNSWDQIWSLDILVDTPEGSVGYNAYWTSLQVTLLGDRLLEDSLRTGLQQTADWTEVFLETGESTEDCNDAIRGNDNTDPRLFEKPDRWPNEKR